MEVLPASPDIIFSIWPFSYRYSAASIVMEAAINIHNTIILILKVKIFIINLLSKY
jgi:hypothetical protein